jgi:acetyltransferase-like isoleucine patch superfamily enzyme
VGPTWADVETPVREQPLRRAAIRVGAGAVVGPHAALGPGAAVSAGARIAPYAVVPPPAEPVAARPRTRR